LSLCFYCALRSGKFSNRQKKTTRRFMGADFPEDNHAIEELRTLSPQAKSWLLHHFGNSLNCVIGGIEIKDYKMAETAARHALADLKKLRGGRRHGSQTTHRTTDRGNE
jgi:hypothetical protein